MRPPERLHMRWTNTWFRQGVELSRGAMQQFNLQQMATGQGQVPLYECHVHALLWPEKMTKTQLIGRNVVRHVDPAFCVIGSQARVLFMRMHAFGGSFHPDGQLPEGWHQGQVMSLDEQPGHRVHMAQQEHVMWLGHPRENMGSRNLTAASTRTQQDVGTDIRGSRARQPRKDATALLQVEGLDCEDANAHLHWKLALQQQVYSNENHRAMLVSQGHPAYGGDKNFFVMGRGEVATQDYAELVGAFFPASMFCSDPGASWEWLLDLMEDQNAANPGLQWLGRVFLAERIHLPGGLRDCLLQDYALLEDSVLADPTSEMVYGSSWFQASMQQLLRSPEGEDQWRRFKAEVCHAHQVGLEALNFIRWSSGNLVMMSMVMQGLVQQHENAALLKSLAKQVQGMSMQQQQCAQLLSPPTKQRRGSLIAASPVISSPSPPSLPMHIQPEAVPGSAVLVEEEFSAPAGPLLWKTCPGIPAAATCPDVAIFSLRGLPDGLQYIPGTGTIRGVAAIMEMWEEGPPVIMSAVQRGVARIPFKQLQHADNVSAKFRSSRDPDKDRMLLQINPGAVACAPVVCALAIVLQKRCVLKSKPL